MPAFARPPAKVIRPARGPRALAAAAPAPAPAPAPAAPSLDGRAARGIAGLLGRAVSLKGVPRQGWIDKAGIARPESVADHSYGTALAAMAAGDALGLDTLRMVRMALLHDLAESVTGDIVPGAVPAAEKAGKERAAMADILLGLPEPARGACAAAWSEFEEGRTAEAAMVREIDKIEMGAQAAAYAAAGGARAGGLAEIAESARRAVSSPAGAALLAEAEAGGGGGAGMAGTAAATAAEARGQGGMPRPGGGGGGADGADEMDAETAAEVVGTLFEVVRRLQANADLDGEYMGIVASGRGADMEGRLARIAAERRGNAEEAARLLRRLEQRQAGGAPGGSL